MADTVRHAQFVVSVSADGIKAVGEFLPAGRGGDPLTVELVEERFAAEGIIRGIRWDVVRTAIKRCNDGERLHDLVVATGTPPVAALPARFLFHPKIRDADRLFADAQAPKPRPGAAEPALRPGEDVVDYRERSPFIIVNKDDVIARVLPPRDGIFGSDVRGQAVPFGDSGIKQPQPGGGIRNDNNSLRADISGQFVWKASEFWIEDTIEVAGEVGYTTGNIRFPGNLVLKGVVKDGFRLWVGGSITAFSTLDAFEVFCKHEIVVAGGIIGRGKGVVRALGEIRAKFVENATVESTESVFVQDSILHSHVNCLGKIVTGDRGTFFGGAITAGSLVLATRIGNRMGVPTVITVGVDYVVERKLAEAKKRLLELNRLQQSVGGHSPGEAERIQRQIDSVGALMEALLPGLDRDESARVMVKGTVFPNVTINICRSTFLVEKEMNRVVFSLDRETGRIRSDPLDK